MSNDDPSPSQRDSGTSGRPTPETPGKPLKPLDRLVAEQYGQDVLRRLDRTGAVIADLRQRTGILLAASGIITALFGPQVLMDPDGARVWIAIGLAVVMLIVGLWNCVCVLYPVKDRERRQSDPAERNLLVRFLRRRHDRQVRAAEARPRWYSYFATYLPYYRAREWKMGLDRDDFDQIADEARDAAGDDEDLASLEVKRRVADKLEEARKMNLRTIDTRSRWFEGACGFLLAGDLLDARTRPGVKDGSQAFNSTPARSAD